MHNRMWHGFCEFKYADGVFFVPNFEMGNLKVSDCPFQNSSLYQVRG